MNQRHLLKVKTFWPIKLLHLFGIYPKDTTLLIGMGERKDQPILVFMADTRSLEGPVQVMLSAMTLTVEQARIQAEQLNRLCDMAEIWRK